ncbi:GHKL domain-containing protein [Facklamia lactis]|uniref:GHKL domain-containing protein n=1 Tax=Facklamia lactis TaxID=2749967 RepID=UPI0018CF482E|nr:GHKL domain-containing protein [Facklamia lactis]MBG9980937.1 GHKL domain-containing protein [Facklamia lactis]
MSLFRNVLLVVVTDWYMNSSLPIILSFNFWLNLTICFVLEVFIFLNRQRIEETVILFIQAKVSKMILLLSILLLAIAFLISSPDMLFLSIFDHNLRDILWSVFIAGSFLLLLLIIWFSFQEKKILVSQFDRQQQEQLQFYLKGLEENQKEIQQFRHDYLNVLLSLEQSIQAKDMEQVEEIYNRIIKPSKAQLNQPSIYYPAIENIQSIEVKSVLFSKVMSASTKNIKVMIDIPDKITIEQVERLDFIRIISIILDNAIEEAELIENSKVIISCFHDQKAIYWIVKNTCSNLEYPLAYYYDEARSSKGENRGIGLVNLQQLIVKYPYLMLDTHFEKGYFVQCLEIITTYAK